MLIVTKSNIHSTNKMVWLIFMLFLIPVQAQGQSNSEKFDGVVKEVKQLVKTDLVTSLEKLTVLNDQLS